MDSNNHGNEPIYDDHSKKWLNQLDILIGFKKKPPRDCFLGYSLTTVDFSPRSSSDVPYFGSFEELDELIKAVASNIPSNMLRNARYDDEPVIQQVLKERIPLNNSTQDKYPIDLQNPQINR